MQTPPTEPSRLVEFTTFMRAYQDMVFSTASRLTGSDAQAEDLSQEVFTKAFENFEHIRSSPTAGGWLKTVTTNLTLNYLTRYRNRWRTASDESEAHLLDAPVPDTALADLDADERHAIIEESLRQLPDHQRVPLVLYHFEDLPYGDIAARLKISLSKAKTDIRRARAALLIALRNRGVEAP